MAGPTPSPCMTKREPTRGRLGMVSSVAASEGVCDSFRTSTDLYFLYPGTDGSALFYVYNNIIYNEILY